MKEPHKATEVYPRVVVDAHIMHGVPVIKGTRIPARLIVGQLAGGESVEAIMEAYAITEEQVRTALGYAESDYSSGSTHWGPNQAKREE